MNQKDSNEINEYKGKLPPLDEMAILGLIFSNKPRELFVFSKLKKLAIAVHLLEGYIEGRGERLFERIKQASLESAKSVLYEDNQHLPIRRITEILMYLETAQAASLVSEMNYQVLRGEYLKILGILEENIRNGNRNQILFPDNFFEVTTPEFSGVGEKMSHGNQLKDVTSPDPMRVVRNVLYGKNEEAPKTDQPKSSVLYEHKNLNNDRLDKIVSFLKKSKQTNSIKDIARIFSGISEKTIQRDLAVLITKGVLRREGKRRWSRYFLV